ncbi:hypothetical protein LAZ40_11820 [Cereibacter sphaeroides]|uniref:hypothetical protein n=1 Tax=Cereibacter sphaeroides TaxID=1063 RepID=UPI001F404CCA|nr:hypothetical protein [Cereibacter sphaeroides]MCE6959707.1 hypothetical protein [Cereibacter sphaeroides]MCE6974432.1 hypothetical protein [Cereibacter sphaeroides]
MFNLIVAVISIALVAALAAASIYYGGTAFSSSTADAAAATLVNNGQQLSGAQQLWMIDNSGNRNVDADLSDLTTGAYLAAMPTPPSSASGTWALDADAATPGTIASITLGAGTSNTEICEAVVDQGGGTAVFADIAALEASDAQFGCVTNATTATDVDFAYKL